MELNTQDKVALSLLKEVEDRIDEVLGNQIAFPLKDEADVGRAIFCKDMIKQCDLAESKSSNPEVILTSTILKAQLFGCWQRSGISTRDTHRKAKEHYEKALQLAPNDESKAYIYYRFALFARVSFMGSKELAIENFQKVIELSGEDSELGIECAKEMAKEQERKKGCFIATAVYGSPYANEVITLREFRDNWLLNYKFGKMFVSMYYWISPPLAKKISRNKYLKDIVKSMVIIPIIGLANKLNTKGD